MIRVALREIRAHLVRFLLSVLAVALGIAFVTGTFSLRALLADTFGAIIESTTQGDLYVRGVEMSEDEIEQQQEQEQEQPEQERSGRQNQDRNGAIGEDDAAGPNTPDDAADAPTDLPSDATGLPEGAPTDLPGEQAPDETRPDATAPSGTAPEADRADESATGNGPPAEEQPATGGGAQLFGPQRVPVPMDLADDVGKVDGVDQAVPDLLGTVVLVGADGQAVVNGQAPSLGSALRENDPSGTLLQGRAPRDETEIALETTALETSGLELGDETQVIVGNSDPRDVTVVGEVTYGNPMVGTILVLVDAATGEAAFAPDGTVPSLAVFLDEGADRAAVAEGIRDVLGPDSDLEVVTGDQAREEGAESINQVLGFLGTFLLVFALISLFVAAFLISNTFAMSVRQRQREFALLRAVGASPGQVMVTVLGQAVVVGLVGSAVGIAGGIGLVAVVRAWLATMSMELGGNVAVTPAEALGALVLGTAIAVVAAAVPARRAATTPPVEAMREDAVTVERSLRLRAAVGALLLAGGVAATLWSVQPEITGAGTWLGVGAGAVLLGTLAVSPVIARAVLRVLAWPFVVLIRPVGRLARGNVMRNPRRTANTAGALMIGMALVAACAVLASSAEESTSSIVADEARADFWLQSATRSIPPGAASAVEEQPEVGRADRIASGRAAIRGPGGASGTDSVLALPADAFGRTIDVETVDGSLGSLADGQVAVSQPTAIERDWHVGDELRITGPNGRHTTEIGAIIASQVLSGDVVMAEADFPDAVPAGQSLVEALLVNAAPGVTQADLRATLEDVTEPYLVVTVQNTDELSNSLADQVEQAMAILYALLGLSVIIAVLGIVNTLALSVIERTREIGLVRAVGLGKLQLAATITIESVLTAVFGTLLGVAVGVGLASALPSVFADEGLTELAIPWDLLGGMVLLSGVVGVIAALWPAWRAAGLPVLEAVTQD
ncbi:ABC transporter permease [Georgenia deserti]|uniref:FtsX-like permease family protein n=1 Tax=Georgenia deserti TaxID=2093781 RepID=A0ABW4L307_9MICO